MAETPAAAGEPKAKRMSVFERYLSLWVALCIVAGTAIGYAWPGFADALSRLQYARISIPVAVLIWLMIYPMMLQIDFASLRRVGERKQGLIVTTVTNWLIKPFTMFAIAWFFMKVVFAPLIEGGLASEYIAGAVLLGAAPCTAMVFVWSYLADGDPVYTLVQVAVNDLILLAAYAPIVMFLLGLTEIVVPYDTVILSVVLFVVVPLVAGYFSRKQLIASKGMQWFEGRFLPALAPVTISALLLTLVLIFVFQGETIVANPLHILLIAVPLTIQTYLIFAVAYGWAWLWRLPHPIAAPAGFVGASNFFELAVAVAIALFGLTSGAALATVVGVLEEVPIMLSLVWIANRTRGWVGRRQVSAMARGDAL
ncbi:MAG: ACR3 family arsenite efflux transporter [Coriobacteriia bacterium]|nr:ACR3 family arsenite efflux transporter [Coriobacteriia bacterium]